MRLFTTAARMWLTRSTRPFQFNSEYERHLPYMETPNLGLYVHIPFCRTLCSFCPYCKVLYEKKICDAYIDSLIEEVHLTGGQNQGRKKVTSLYFGGGSPALAADRLNDIISAVSDHFIITDGIGLELHPDDISIPLLLTLKQAGITKISIGVQSFQPSILRTLGRAKIDQQELFSALKSVPFDTVSMDFIFALPGQTLSDLKRDLNTAFQNGANHIAIYPFVRFSFARTRIRPMKKAEKRRLLDEITVYLIEKGYIRDSIWTFSRHQDARYSSMTRDNFLGFGCSATTLLEGQFKINTFSVEAYRERILQHQLPTALTLRFTKRQRMVYYLFWTAYRTRVDPRDFEKFFGIPLKRCYGMEFWLATKGGLLRKTGQTYEMTLKGAFFYHHFEGYYTLAYIDKMWNNMRTTPFPEKITF